MEPLLCRKQILLLKSQLYKSCHSYKSMQCAVRTKVNTKDEICQHLPALLEVNPGINSLLVSDDRTRPTKQKGLTHSRIWTQISHLPINSKSVQ